MAKRKRANSEVKEDRISALPDALIHHILSLLPSTREAIQTGILSKRWHNQWTHLPLLIFDCSGMPYGFPHDHFSRNIDNALILHNCPTLLKFHILLFGCDSRIDSHYDFKLRFAVRKQVQELRLRFYVGQEFSLPEFLFDYAFLVRLQVYNCSFVPKGSVNWGYLTELNVECCSWANGGIERVLFGSPLLESLELKCCGGSGQLGIVSKSLKRLVLDDLAVAITEISCPNLEELSTGAGVVVNYLRLSDRVIENVVSGSPFLRSLEVADSDGFERLCIASKSLKILVLNDVVSKTLEILCPNLEELKFHGLENDIIIKLTNLPSSICVFLDFEYLGEGCDEDVAKQILEQIQHVKELKIGTHFIRILSVLVLGGQSPSISNKCLTLTLDGGPNWDENLPGIAYTLQSSPQLEKLVIKLLLEKCAISYKLPYLDNVCGDNYWNESGTYFSCLESHLKAVTLIGLSKNDGKRKLVYEFVEFLLKKAKVLEKIVVVLADYEVDFVFEVSQKLLGFSRCSQHLTVELLCSK